MTQPGQQQPGQPQYPYNQQQGQYQQPIQPQQGYYQQPVQNGYQPQQPGQWNPNGVYGGAVVPKKGIPWWGWLLMLVVIFALGVVVTLAVTGVGPFQQKTKGQQVVDLFKLAGLEAENPSPMKKEDFGPTPQVAIEAIHFYAPSIDNTGTSGGRIMVFSSQKDLEIVKNYYVAFGDSNRQLFSWVFVKDNVLVQINGDLPQSKALQYEAALNKI
jgi:hypothetical protein